MQRPEEPDAGTLPPAGTLQAALRSTTERLARELAAPSGDAPDWSPLEWHTARAAAAIHGVSPLLATALRWQGPPDWQDFLAGQRDHTVHRHARMQAMLALLDERLRRAGVAGLALKGVELHALGLYAAGERPMADLDLLVRDSDAAQAVTVLTGLGFREILRTYKDRTFVRSTPLASPVAPGEHRARDVKIELHTRILERLPWRLTDITGAVFPAEAHPGLNPYPCLAALMSHLLLHASGAMAARTMRLMHLNDLARLALRMRPEDWNGVLALRTASQGPWWALPPLLLTARYYTGAIPEGVLHALKPRCPRLLRQVSRRQCLSDVSLSRLWIEALPGLEWARSVREMLSYLNNRLRPGAQQRANRMTQLGTDEWAASQEWCRLPQWQRVLRWVVSRPARPQTLHAVRAALAPPLPQ